MFQSTPTGFPAGDVLICMSSMGMRSFQSTPTGFPAGDAPSDAPRVSLTRFQSTPTGFPAGDLFAAAGLLLSLLFQSTPTGFPAGDRFRSNSASGRACFNPRRPVSRPATQAASADVGQHVVSIHADRFPGRRLCAGLLTPSRWQFQSTPTGFPAGD